MEGTPIKMTDDLRPSRLTRSKLLYISTTLIYTLLLTGDSIATFRNCLLFNKRMLESTKLVKELAMSRTIAKLANSVLLKTDKMVPAPSFSAVQKSAPQQMKTF